MASFKPAFSRVKGVSEKRRLPRLGRVRLGVKAISPKTGKEFPKEVDYFVVPPEVAKIYGEKPKELDMMFPLNDIEVIFPQSYNWWGSSRGVKCRGDGERAMRATEDGFQEIECPCPKLESGECRFQAYLMGILYKVSLGGIYQITLGSYNSTVDINSGLDYASAMIGRFVMVPFKLRRVERETHHDNMKQIHYPLVLTPDVDLNSLNELRQDTQRILTDPRYILPAPEDTNPKLDDGAVVVVEEAEGTESEPEAPEIQGNAQTRVPDIKKAGGAAQSEQAGQAKQVGQVAQGKKKSLDEQILELLEKVELPSGDPADKEELKKDLPGLGAKIKQARLEWLKGLPKKEAEQPEPAKQPEPEKKPAEQKGPQEDLEKKAEKDLKEEKKATEEDRDDILNLLEFAEPARERGEAIKTELEGELTSARAKELKSELNTLVDKHLGETENEAENEGQNRPITEKQHKLLEAKLKESEIDREGFKLWLNGSLGFLEPGDDRKLHMNQIGSKHFQSLMEDWDMTLQGFKSWETAQTGEGQENSELPF